MSSVGELVTAISEWPPRYFMALAFVAGALLLASHSPWADAAGLSTAPAWFRLALTVSTLSCLAIGSVKLWSGYRVRAAAHAVAVQRGRAFDAELRSLTPDEYAVLARFMDRNSKTATFLVSSENADLAATAHSLAMRGHLYVVTSERNLWYVTTTYALQDRVYDFLRRHPDVLPASVRQLPPGE